MAYQDYKTVADGIGKQLDACLTALDQAQNGKKDPPQEIQELEKALNRAGEICGRIEAAAEDEIKQEEE